MRIAIATLSILALAGCSDLVGGAGSYGESEALAGAEFRFAAREAVGALEPVCPFTADADLLSQYEPLKTRFEALQERIEGTALASDLAVVNADYRYFWEQNPTDCGDVDTPGTAERLEQEFVRIAAALERMERAAGVN